MMRLLSCPWISLTVTSVCTVTLSVMSAAATWAMSDRPFLTEPSSMLKGTAQDTLEEARETLLQSQPSQQPSPSQPSQQPSQAQPSQAQPSQAQPFQSQPLQLPPTGEFNSSPFEQRPWLDGGFDNGFNGFNGFNRLDTSPQPLEFDVYRLGPGDSFYVNVEGFPEVNFQATLDLEGNVLVPLVGIRSFQGLTLTEAKAMLQAEMMRLFVNPVVDLTLVARRPVRVTLLGEVFRPGFYPLADPQLTSAILSAGGVTRLANLKTIQVRRAVLDRAGHPMTMLEQNFDLFEALSNGQALPNVRLEDGDVVIIPTLTEVDATEYDRTLVARSNLATPSMTIRVLSHPTRIGNLNLPNGSTFVDAVTALSPSLTEANLRTIGLIRFDPELGEVTTQELNAKQALMGDASQNVVLEEHDVLVVSRSLLGRVTHYLNTFTQPFRDVLGFLLFFDTLATSADNIFAPAPSAAE